MFGVGYSIPIRLTLIREIFTKPHAIDDISKFDSCDNGKLLRKLDEIGFDIFPFTVDQYGEVGSCGSTFFLVSASGYPFPSTSGVISAYMLCFAALASAARRHFAHLPVVVDL
jgi:hypothetical protein